MAATMLRAPQSGRQQAQDGRSALAGAVALPAFRRAVLGFYETEAFLNEQPQDPCRGRVIGEPIAQTGYEIYSSCSTICARTRLGQHIDEASQERLISPLPAASSRQPRLAAPTAAAKAEAERAAEEKRKAENRKRSGPVPRRPQKRPIPRCSATLPIPTAACS